MAELFKLVGTIAIETESAKQSIDAVITAGADLEAKLNGIGANAESSFGSKSGFSSASVWMGNMLTQLTNKAAELGKTIWNAGFKMNLSEENWVASFKTYLGGDLEEAEAIVARMKQFAIDTPLTMQEVMAQATQLLATGTEPEKLIEVMSMLGDVSRGDMTYFSRIATAYWQIMSTGRLLAQDANQLTQAGVPVWQLVADYFNAIERDGKNDWTKETTRALSAQAAKTGNTEMAISSEELYQALLFSTSETGMYFNAMNNAMDTTQGKLQKLQDAFTLFAASLTEPFANVMGSETLDKMTESFDRFTAWAEKNPEVLNNLAIALSDLATFGLDTLLGSFQGLLEFWNTNQDMFNKMLQLFGGVAFASGHPAAGTALLIAGGAKGLEELKKELNGISSDVNLPFIYQQLEQQGKADQWEAYLENWKSARRDEGYTDADIDSFVKSQFANYQLLTSEELNELTGGGNKQSIKEWYDLLFPGTSWLIDQLFPSGNNGKTGGSLNQLRNNMYNHAMLFASTSGVPERSGRDSSDTGFAGFGVPSDFDGGANGTNNIAGLIAAVQGLTASVQSMTGEIPSAISSGIGNITVTGSITTGNVTLDTGAVVGSLLPRLDLKLGKAGGLAGRG